MSDKRYTTDELINLLKIDVTAFNQLNKDKPSEVIDLRYANLRYANLRYANLRDANLRGANLRDANLRGANLHGGNLRDANLRGANLHGGNLRDANLRGADLHGGNLRDANLRGANLRYANLRDANLRGANLRYANLHGAVGIYSINNNSLEYGLYGSLHIGENTISLQLSAGCKTRLSVNEFRSLESDFAYSVNVKAYKLAIDYMVASFEMDMDAGKWDYLIEIKERSNE